MNDIKFKNFISKSDILHPIVNALIRVNKINELKNDNQPPIIIEGLFVMVVSIFETTLNDTLSVILKSIPNKLTEKSYTISKVQILDENPLTKVVENFIHAISYNSIEKYFLIFSKITSIDISIKSQKLINQLIELKTSRNLLIHNNLIVNDIYCELNRSNGRSNQIGDKLEISDAYLHDSINCVSNILENIKEQLEIKYNKLTKINAIKSLWQRIFGHSVCCNFDREWEYDIENDKILKFKDTSTASSSLSHSEKFIFDFWYCHYHGKEFNSGGINLRSLGKTARNRLKLLIDNIDLVIQ